MSAWKGTPGPWVASANAYGTWFVNGGPEAETAVGTKYRALVCGGNNSDTLTEANAKGIAAVPQLVEALLPFGKISVAVEHTDIRDGEVVHRQRQGDKYVELVKDDFRRAVAALKAAGVDL